MERKRLYVCREKSCLKKTEEPNFCFICEHCPKHCYCEWKKELAHPAEPEAIVLDIAICTKCQEGFESFIFCKKCKLCPACCEC